MSDELEYLGRRVAAGKLNRREFLGRAAALGVSAAFANTLLTSAVRAAGPVKGGALKAGLQGGESTDGLDPAAINNQVTGAFARCWGEKLIDIDENGKIVHRLAEEYGSSADAKTWTFKIRKGVTFHNGKELDANDVMATIERHAGPETKSGALGVLRGIDQLKVDGNDFVITLKEANADLPFLMSDYHLIVQPNGGKDNPQAGIGTGPYKIASHEPGVRELGTRHEGYWDADNGGFADQVEIVVINDSTARMAALRGGQVHMMNRVEPKIVDLVKRIPGIAIKNVAGGAHYVFAMQCNTAPFDNNDLRLALKYAVDRQEMVDKIVGGYGSVGNDIPVNKSYPLFSDDIEQRVFDPEKAAFHFKKSGHSGPIQLITSEVAFPGAVDAAQLFQQSCAKAGIQLDVQRAPGDGYWAEVWNKKPFSASYWVGRPTQDQQYSTAYLSTADWNETRFKRDDFDKLVAGARAELDEAKRKAMYRDIALLVRDEGGAIIPMYNDWIDAVSEKVGGYIPYPSGELMGGLALARCWLTA
ncbi:peptide/nickel transport system substrate-binding protein [Mesorhizobium soli]|uniref:ABC transporter substrate-binding protein n=1 Tax=Pseudaminobacter soli (ex Li et al. 2025) TaxID=1295366 RepID=UPI002476014F|nr:ABC transporter substrate-binding protein [Mesorhizobium soli]MDH6233656.1 peptide/nickel transport system substrate-binding protein [Mesorhizobium soli]